jgi:hypothetical protein
MKNTLKIGDKIVKVNGKGYTEYTLVSASKLNDGSHILTLCPSLGNGGKFGGTQIRTTYLRNPKSGWMTLEMYCAMNKTECAV